MKPITITVAAVLAAVMLTGCPRHYRHGGHDHGHSRPPHSRPAPPPPHRPPHHFQAANYHQNDSSAILREGIRHTSTTNSLRSAEAY